MYFWISVLVITLFSGQTSAVVDKRFPTNRNGDKMTNVVEKDGFLFVAENGILHQLDLALTSIKSFNTCVSDICDNINKVLVLSGDLLVLCGTGNNGVCQALNGSKVVYSSSIVDSDSNYLTVSTSIDAPAVGIAFEGSFYLGRSMKNEDGKTFRNYITRTRIDNNFENIGSAYIFAKEHPVYFKNVFEHNESIFFLTNQRYNLTSNKMVSKLICINATEPYDVKKNLSETILTCQADGDEYSLVQDGAYLPAKGVLVAAFSQGDDPENPLSNSAVCAYDIGALSSPISILKLDNTRITRLKGIDRYGLYPDVFVGTDTGSVIKLSVNNSLQVNVYKNNTVIDRGHPITDIHIGEDEGYVVTNRKISSFKNTKCSIFKTCKETMASRNPECGWFLKNSTSTKRIDGSSGWISSLAECVSIDASPKYVAVSEIFTTELTITAVNIPQNVSTEVKCGYLDGGVQQGGLLPTDKNGNNTFICNITSKAKHIELTLQLVAVNGFDVLFIYAETSIQIYDCGNFTTCGTCLQSPEIQCIWCGSSLTCQNNALNCSNNQQTTTYSSCPRLKEAQITVPNGITKEVTLEVANMITDVNYTCVIEQNGTSVEIPAILNNGSVKVPLNVSFDEDDAKMDIPLHLFQVNGQTKSKVENIILVTVYKCERLGTDCTKCGALKPKIYDCKWCQSGPCVHTSQCSQNKSCPLPQITEIEPARGGYKGGTELIIKGTNLGTNANSITKVKVGNVDCTNINVCSTSSDLDFDIFNSEIRCTVTPKLYGQDRIGQHNVTFLFDGNRTGNGKYSFEDPVIETIVPSFGPIIGGTLLTLSGRHLNIEKGDPTVRLGTRGLCTHVTTQNETLTCITPSVTKSGPIKIVKFRWLDFETYESYPTFEFLATPNITGVLKAQSIISGGTGFSTKGIHLNNTANIVVIAEYAEESETESCVASSASSLDCRMPMAPSIAVQEMEENIRSERRRRKRSADDSSSITIKVSIKMDGYVKTFNVEYFRDPNVESFQETTSVFSTGERSLNITGDYLDLVGRKDDYTILIGPRDCRVETVTRTYIICIPPIENPDTTPQTLEVVVHLGNFKQTVGHVRYDAKDGSAVAGNVHYTLVIVLSGVGVVLFIAIIIGVVLFCYKYIRAKARILKIKIRKRKKSDELNEMSTSRLQTETVVDNHSSAHNVVERSVYIDLDENRCRPVYQDLDHHGHDNLGVSDYQGLDQRQDDSNHVYEGLE